MVSAAIQPSPIDLFVMQFVNPHIIYGKIRKPLHRFSVVLIDIIDFVFYVFVYIILPIIFVLLLFCLPCKSMGKPRSNKFEHEFPNLIYRSMSFM
jgi:hypothetical protein